MIVSCGRPSLRYRRGARRGGRGVCVRSPVYCLLLWVNSFFETYGERDANPRLRVCGETVKQIQDCPQLSQRREGRDLSPARDLTTVPSLDSF